MWFSWWCQWEFHLPGIVSWTLTKADCNGKSLPKKYFLKCWSRDAWNVYSLTFRKRPPKVPRSQSLTGGGLLWESNHRGSIPRSGPDTFTFWQIIFLSYIHCVVPLCHWKFLIYCEWPSSYSEQGDHMMCQVVAYKRLKTTENYKTIMPISGRSRLWEVIVYKRFTHRALTGKILVFWMAGA